MGEHYYEIGEYPFARIVTFFRPLSELSDHTDLLNHLSIELSIKNEQELNACFYMYHTTDIRITNRRMFIYNAIDKKLYHIEIQNDVKLYSSYSDYDTNSIISIGRFRFFTTHHKIANDIPLDALDLYYFDSYIWDIIKSDAIKHEYDDQNSNTLILRLRNESKAMYRLSFIYPVMGSLIYLLLKQKQYNTDRITLNLYYNDYYVTNEAKAIPSGIYISFINDKTDINPDYGKFIHEMLHNLFF